MKSSPRLRGAWFRVLAFLGICAATAVPLALWLTPLGALAGRRPVRGIEWDVDLRGGSTLELEVPGEVADPVERDRLADQMAAVLGDRLGRTQGLEGASATREDEGRVRIILPGAGDEEVRRAEALVGIQGSLEFRLAAEIEVEEAEWPRFEPLAGKAGDDPERRDYERRLATARGLLWLPNGQPDARRPHRLIVLWEEDGSGARVEFPVFRGSDLVDVGIETIPEIQPHAAFGGEAARRFHEFTGRITGRPLSIVFDGEVVGDPIVEAPLEGTFIIRGLAPETARSLKAILESGRLEVRPVIVSRRTFDPEVPPRSVLAAAAVMALVLLASGAGLVVRYRALGFAGLVAIALQLAISTAILAVLGATVGLSGLGGLALGVVVTIPALFLALAHRALIAPTFLMLGPLVLGAGTALVGFAGAIAGFGLGLSIASGSGLVVLWALVDPLVALAGRPPEQDVAGPV